MDDLRDICMTGEEESSRSNSGNKSNAYIRFSLVTVWENKQLIFEGP